MTDTSQYIDGRVEYEISPLLSEFIQNNGMTKEEKHAHFDKMIRIIGLFLTAIAIIVSIIIKFF